MKRQFQCSLQKDVVVIVVVVVPWYWFSFICKSSTSEDEWGPEAVGEVEIVRGSNKTKTK